MFSLATDACPGRPNEDFALAATDLAVLVDGDGMPQGGCTHGVAWFARQLAAQTVAALVAEATLPLAEGLARAIRAVARLHVYTCDLDADSAPSAAVGILRVGADQVDTLALSGCVVVAETASGPEVTRGRPEPGRAAADPRAAQLAVCRSFARHDVRRAAILSDGAAWPVELVRIEQWPRYLDLLASVGPAGLIARTRALAAGRTDATTHPADDATAIYFAG